MPITIRVDGSSYHIGPDDNQYASVKTGIDGALVITSGYSESDGSDTPDLFAPALRVWAAFMDPYERIVVNPDHEFHGRISTAHTDANDNDPDKVNLVTTQSYAGTKNSAMPTLLFSSDEQKAGQATHCASAIGQMKSGVGFGGGGSNNSASILFNKLMLHTSGRKQAHRALRGNLSAANAAGITAVAAPLPKYVAYSDQASSGYFPTNIPAVRPTTVQQATGLIFNKPKDQPITATTLQVVHHTDAQAAFDALPPATVNPPWQPAPPNNLQRADGVYVVQGTRNIFTDFWNWLKGVVAEITDLIVTIADEVMVGIRMIVNGIEQVFKAIIKVIDDIASAIGSFFKMLVKLIEDVIAALSVLFHFGEILWTHRWLAAQFQTQIKQLATTIQTQAVPQVDQFFTNGENAVKTAFDAIRKSIGGNDSVSNVKGMGATPHTVFAARPGGVGPSSGGASHSTQCSWGIQKFKSGSSSATSKPPSPSAAMVSTGISPSQTVGDPVGDFFAAFVARLNNNADLGSVFNQLQSDFGKLFHPSSAGQFFSTFLTTLLDIVEAILLSVMAIGDALVGGILSVAQAAIDGIMAFLNYELEIPVITWLYEKLFGEKLTFLNLATLVAAIPVTILFRVIEGQYPSQAGLPNTLGGAEAQHGADVSATAAAPKVAQQVLATFTGVFAIVQGICNGIGDAEGDDAPPITGILSAGLGLLITAFSVPAITSDTPSTEDWLVFGISAAWSLATVLGLPNFNLADQAVLPWCNSGMGLLVLICTIVAFVDDHNTDVISDIGFAGGIASAVPGMLNAVKLAPQPAPVVVGVVDVVGGVVSGLIDMIVAYASSSPAPMLNRLYVPALHADTSMRWPLADDKASNFAPID